MRLFRETAEKTVDEPGRRRWEGPRLEVIRGNGTLREVPMLTRYRLFKTPFGGVYVHHWHRPDSDKDCHDHPWWFASLILRGGYTEEIRPVAMGAGSVLRCRRRFSVHGMPLRSAHRVVSLDSDTWTLMLVGRKVQDWSFYVHNRFEPRFSVNSLASLGEESVLKAGGNIHPLAPLPPVRVPWQAYIAQGGNPDPFNC